MAFVSDPYAQLALHALALLPLGGAGSLFAERYLAWCRASLPEEAFAPVTRDAPLVASLHEARGRPLALQVLPALFDDLDAFLRSGHLDLADLDGHARPGPLRALRAVDPTLVELVRVAMLLAAEAFVASAPHEACDQGREALAPALALARSRLPALAEARVELAWALGPRGRAFPERILVGVPGDWGGLAPETAAVLAMHEAAVRDAGGDYVEAEWRGLVAVARALADGPDALGAAHRAWLATLDLDALSREAAARGLVDRALAEAIASEPEARADRLAR